MIIINIIWTGAPSRIHDSRIFSLSFLWGELSKICNDTFHLLGDSAYPNIKELLVPFKHNQILTAIQRNYNYRLSSTRVVIENAFGILKQRFRQLIMLDFHTVNKITKFILSCCVLHNLCIDSGDEDPFPDADDIEDQEEEQPNQQLNITEVAKQLGKHKREMICLQLPFTRR